jgi:hypothetical protein
VKQRQFYRQSAVKEKRSKKPFSLAQAYADLPHIVKAPFYGLLLGILVIILLPYFWESPWTPYVSAGATVIFILFGVVTGSALDLRENIKDNLK